MFSAQSENGMNMINCSTIYNVPKLLEMNGDGKLNVALSDDPVYAKVRITQKPVP